MNLNQLLKGVECKSCGRVHTCPIEHIYVESDAISHLRDLCKDYTRILLVADENTYLAGGEKTEKSLEGKEITRVIFSGKTILVPNENAIERVKSDLGNNQIIVGIGSGVIQDLCKYVSHFHKIPYIIVATAPSMDGYASNGAAMILKGMKDTVPCGLPKAIIADTQVLKNAPMEMIKAGYGDIVGKLSALNDWKLSRVVNDEYFCQYIYDETYKMIDATIKTAKGLLERDEESIKALSLALMQVGIMMSFATTSRPASGSEHHLSHFFEITGIVHGEEYLPHGVDVAFSTVITQKLREEILKLGSYDRQYIPQRQEYEAIINKLYGVVGSGCIALQDKMKRYVTDRSKIYKEKEREIREILKEVPPSGEILRLLSLASLDISQFEKAYSKEKIENAILYAKDLKDRYTVLWLYYDLLGDKNETYQG
ncbi:MAG: sn-glycerol-1-phosphate dehydrogenase [Clostridia bacterium]|nr:sn-glycerol-1-phosphate dehydrogenase [Clostridia bacterium]